MNLLLVYIANIDILSNNVDKDKTPMKLQENFALRVYSINIV